MNYYGSLCLSDIPKELLRKAENGKTYLNIRVVKRKEADKFGNTHFVSCAPKKDEQKEGVNYIFGHLKESESKPNNVVSDNDLPL